MTTRIIAWLGAICSFIGLWFTADPGPVDISRVVPFVVLGMALLVLIVFDAKEMLAKWNRSYTDDEKIRRYMERWISSGGRTAIFTRDMTWADSVAVRGLLTKKATAGELTLFMPEKTDLARELERVGATIHEYQWIDYIPQSRFTVINQDRADAHVAVGRRVDGRHLIEEFAKGEHPAYSLAEDLLEILRRSCTAMGKTSE